MMTASRAIFIDTSFLYRHSGVDWFQLRENLVTGDVHAVLGFAVGLDRDDEILLDPARVETALARDFLDDVDHLLGAGYYGGGVGRTLASHDRMGGPELRIYLAGNIALEQGETLVPQSRLPGSQGRLAFALLVAERSNALSTEHIADVVWDGEPPSSWGTALRAIISKLRGVIAGSGTPGTIEHAFGCYQLRLPPDTWVDVEAAAEAAHDAEAWLRSGRVIDAHGAALVANAIARRPFLEGAEGTWVQQQRETLRSIQIRALSCRAEIAGRNGDHAGAVGDAERIIALEPYREPTYVTLMQAHVAAGNVAEAVATYERLRSMLAEDLGTNPSPATEQAFIDVLRAT